MNELTKKIDKIIRAKFPDYSELEIEEMIEDYAEIGFLELMNSIYDQLGHVNGEFFKSMFLNGKVDEALDYVKSNNIDIEKTFEEVAKKVVVDIFG